MISLFKNQLKFSLVFVFILSFAVVYSAYAQRALFSQEIGTENGMVASAHPLASSAGVEILKKGGNAIDAAVATAFALAVVEPNASGLGGGGFMVIKMVESKNAVTIDYRECAPEKASPELYYQSDESFDAFTRRGAKSIGVPGVLAGLNLALEKYGTMKLRDVLQPAIRLANEGFVVSEKFAGLILQNYDLIFNNPGTAKIYLHDGLPLEQGALIKNPDLAGSFQKIADGGSRVFYQGKIAHAIIDQIQKADGILTLNDLKNYKAVIKTPVYGKYRDFEIYSSAPPSGGGTHLIELLNILEGYDLAKMEHNSAPYIHLLAESMKMIFADKSSNMADPAFYKVPVAQLTDKQYAAQLRKRIDQNKASNDYKSVVLLDRESSSTTHLSVVDNDRNIIALTQSINLWFGCGITVQGTGILLNNHLGDFVSVPDKPNSIEPNKRPVSSIAPTIILKNGKPFLTIGTPGGSRIISALAQIIVNIVDFEMPVDAAIETPRIHCFKKMLKLEGRIPKSVASQLEQMGHKVEFHEDYDNYFGGAQGIMIDYSTGIMYGGADSRRDGVAIGY